MSSRGSRTASGGSASSADVAQAPSPSPPSSPAPDVATEQKSGTFRRPFSLGSRSLHSLRRLKDLEEADASLGIPEECAPSSFLPGGPAGPTEAAEGPHEATAGASDSEDDTLEVVRSMKDLQRMRGGPRKGLDVRAGLEEPTETKDEDEEEDAVGLLEKNFASGGPGSAADRHL